MTPLTSLAPLLVKEIRGLVPAWLIALGVMVLSAGMAGDLGLASSPSMMFGDRSLRGLGLAYVVGALSIGALSIGQEYGHRTVGALLSQPIGRGRLLVVKLGVVLLLGIPVDTQYMQLAVPVAMVTIASLYVSSLSTSGLWAFLISVAVTIGILPFVLTMWMTNRANQYSRTYRAALDRDGPLALLLAGGVLLVMLALAFQNHRSAERSTGRIWKQVFALSGCLAFAFATWAIVPMVA